MHSTPTHSYIEPIKLSWDHEIVTLIHWSSNPIACFFSTLACNVGKVIYGLRMMSVNIWIQGLKGLTLIARRVRQRLNECHQNVRVLRPRTSIFPTTSSKLQQFVNFISTSMHEGLQLGYKVKERKRLENLYYTWCDSWIKEMYKKA